MVMERHIETALIAATRVRGGQCWKFTSPGTVGVPDRIIIVPGGQVGFVEVKAPGKKPRPIQARRIRQLQALGVLVFVIDEQTQIEGALDAICAS